MIKDKNAKNRTLIKEYRIARSKAKRRAASARRRMAAEIEISRPQVPSPKKAA